MYHDMVVLLSIVGVFACIVVLAKVKNNAVRCMALLLALFGVVLVTSPPRTGEGSYICAKLMKNRLAQCDSLNDVRKRFKCARWEPTGLGGDLFTEDPNTLKNGNTRALLYEFPDGDWLAMAYRSSHGNWGGGTVVTRGSDGRIRVYFGHVCGAPWAPGQSLEEAYASLLAPPFPLREVSHEP